MFLAFCANVLTLIGLFCFILEIRYHLEVVYIVWILFSILSFFILNKKKYDELEQQYKNEKNSNLKGWLVFTYIVGSVVLYFISLVFM